MTYHAAVFGNPIAQSKSPLIHHNFAKQFGIDLVYVKQQSEMSQFEDDLKRFFTQKNSIGVNVTAPFKENAFNWVSEHTDFAARAGAVNTIIRKPNTDTFIGANSDGLGLIADLAHHQLDLADKSVLLIGAGGAAKGALPAIVGAGVKHISIYNRTKSKAESLIKETQEYASCDLLASIDETKVYDLIINASSASLTQQVPDVPAAIFTNRTVAYDMAYSDKLTPFCQLATDSGCKHALDGLGMLVEQAAVSFECWFNERPKTDDIRKLLRA